MNFKHLLMIDLIRQTKSESKFFCFVSYLFNCICIHKVMFKNVTIQNKFMKSNLPTNLSIIFIILYLYIIIIYIWCDKN